MKSVLKIFLLAFAIATNANAAEIPVEQDKYNLVCEIGAVCFEQDLKKAKHEFRISPGSVVNIQVKAANGASVTMVSGGDTMSAAYLSVGHENVVSQTVQLEGHVDQSGKFTLDVQIAKVAEGGEVKNVDNGYNLKITKVGTNPEIPGVSI